MKNFNNFGVHGKMQVLEVGVHKNIRVAWTVFRFKGGLGKKEGGGVFEGGWFPNAHYAVKKVLEFTEKWKYPKFRGKF